MANFLSISSRAYSFHVASRLRPFLIASILFVMCFVDCAFPTAANAMRCGPPPYESLETAYSRSQYVLSATALAPDSLEIKHIFKTVGSDLSIGQTVPFIGGRFKPGLSYYVFAERNTRQSVAGFALTDAACVSRTFVDPQAFIDAVTSLSKEPKKQAALMTSLQFPRMVVITGKVKSIEKSPTGASMNQSQARISVDVNRVVSNTTSSTDPDKLLSFYLRGACIEDLAIDREYLFFTFPGISIPKWDSQRYPPPYSRSPVVWGGECWGTRAMRLDARDAIDNLTK